MNPRVSTLLARHLADPRSAWGVGVAGATAEFIHDEDTRVLDVADIPMRLVTESGAIVVGDGDAHPVAYDVPSRQTGGLRRGMLFCLSEAAAALPCHTTLMELGPDENSARPADAEAILFDLGLGVAHLQACVRVSDPGLAHTLRALCGEAVLQPGASALPLLLAHGPHRVFRTALARIEVYLPIPVHETPSAPHTHLLPDRLKRTPPYETPVPVPDGMVSCLELFEPGPVSKAGDSRG